MRRADMEKVGRKFISLRFDGCISLSVHISQSELNYLQLVQNTATLTGMMKWEHITPVLSSLHWLPVSYMIDFRILLFAFKFQHCLAPIYLLELIHVQPAARDLRSADQMLWDVPGSHLKQEQIELFQSWLPHCGKPCLSLSALWQASLFSNQVLRPTGFLWLLAECLYLFYERHPVFACPICCFYVAFTL